jgi:GntR family transcriptional regulator/MocR family aminotransferase
MRGLYAERRAALAHALGEAFGDGLRIELQAGGMHLLARLPPSADDVSLSERANAAGQAIAPLSATAVAHDCGRGLLLGFTNVPADAATLAADRLHRAIGPLLPSR